MKNKGERVKELRKNLNLSMEKFAEPLGVTRTAINDIEKGKNNLTDQMAKLICQSYRVDYFWLTEGTGEMFIEMPDEIIDRLIEEYDLDQRFKPILSAFVDASPNQQKAVIDYLYSVLDRVNKQKNSE